MPALPLTWVWVPLCVLASVALPVGALLTALVLRRKQREQTAKEALRGGLLALVAPVLPPLGFVAATWLGPGGFGIPMALSLLATLLANVQLALTVKPRGLDLWIGVGMLLLFGTVGLQAVADSAELNPEPLIASAVAVVCGWGSLGGLLIAIGGAVAAPLPPSEEESPPL